jgi:hypothetical protein
MVPGSPCGNDQQYSCQGNVDLSTFWQHKVRPRLTLLYLDCREFGPDRLDRRRERFHFSPIPHLHLTQASGKKNSITCAEYPVAL